MKYLISILLIVMVVATKAQSEEDGDEGLFVPFSLFMEVVIDAKGQERLDAIDRTFEAIKNNSTDTDYLSIPSLYFFQTRELALQGRYDEALEAVLALRKISPGIVSNLLPNAPAWAYSLSFVSEGYIYWIKDDLPLAKAYFDSANTYFNDGFYANYYLGWFAQSANNDEKALEHYTQADLGVTVMKVDRAEMLYKKANIYHTQKLYSQAVNEYTKSIQAYPLCKSYLERGRVYYFSSAYPDKKIAYDDFRAIIENCQNYENLGLAYSFLAGDYYDKRQDAKALEYYKKAYELQGNYYDAGGVAIGYYALKDWSNTTTWATKAINAALKTPNADKRSIGDYYFYRGYANWQLQKMDATVNDLLKARSYGHRMADDYLKQYFNR